MQPPCNTLFNLLKWWLLTFSQCSGRWLYETTVIHMVFGVCVQDRREKVGPLRCRIQKTYCSKKAILKEEKCWVALPTPTQTNMCIRSLPSTQNTKQWTLFSIIIRSIWEFSRKAYYNQWNKSNLSPSKQA